VGEFVLSETGHLYVQNSAFTSIFTFTDTVPLNQWFRIEGSVFGSSTAGQLQLSLFDSPNSTVATQTETSAATQNTFGSPDRCYYGVAQFYADIGPFWMADIGVSNTGYLGPVSSGLYAAIFP
jgi:hypothetical protein